MQIHHHRGQTDAKKGHGHFEQRSGHKAKTLYNLCGWLER